VSGPIPTACGHERIAPRSRQTFGYNPADAAGGIVRRSSLYHLAEPKLSARGAFQKRRDVLSTFQSLLTSPDMGCIAAIRLACSSGGVNIGLLFMLQPKTPCTVQ
jgi:hypothetical protein